MAVAVGINLGAAWSRAVVVRDGAAEPEATVAIPSVVAVGYDGAELVGDPRAVQLRFMDPRRAASPVEALRALGDEHVAILGATRAVRDLLRLLMRKLVVEAEEAAGAVAETLALALSPSLDDNRQAALVEAGRGLGRTVVETLEEPVAIVVASGEEAAKSTTLVVDLGAATLDVAVVQAARRSLQVAAQVTEHGVGGDALDQAIVDELVADLRVQLRDATAEGVDLSRDRMAQRRLYTAAETARIDLSTSASLSSTFRSSRRTWKDRSISKGS